MQIKSLSVTILVVVAVGTATLFSQQHPTDPAARSFSSPATCSGPTTRTGQA